MLLYDGLSLSWITLLVAIVGMALAMIGGMPAMVRTRFSTPTIGREWMVGEVGHRRRPRRPRRHRHASATRRGGPAPTGPRRSTRREPVRVVSIDGLLLEVEPLDGRRQGPPRPTLSGRSH